VCTCAVGSCKTALAAVRKLRGVDPVRTLAQTAVVVMTTIELDRLSLATRWHNSCQRHRVAHGAMACSTIGKKKALVSRRGLGSSQPKGAGHEQWAGADGGWPAESCLHPCFLPSITPVCLYSCSNPSTPPAFLPSRFSPSQRRLTKHRLTTDCVSRRLPEH